MMVSISIIPTLVFVTAILIETVNCDGIFYIQRIESACLEITLKLNTNGSRSDNCLTYDWSEISNLTTNYTTYLDMATAKSYYARIGALTVQGTIENYNLNYQCPPTGYNGVGSGCSVQPNTQLVVLHVNTLDGKLYGMDIILSGAPFPNSENLKENMPPFGKAHITLTLGVSVQSSGYFQICKNKTSNQCPSKNLTAHKLPHPLPSNYGYGIFGIQAYDFVTNSTWIMDDLNQLLIVTAGTTYYYFNATGFFMYDSDKKTCTWSPTCNYVCEAYNYDSRFLDYSGEWVIMNKWGIKDMKPLTVEIWIGNAIDAAGIFPIVMYTDKKTGHYLGLDKLDSIPAPKMGATFWYTEHGNTTSRVSITNFKPNVVEGGCVKSMNQWTGTWKNHGTHMKYNYAVIMLTFVCLKIFHQYM